MKKAMKKSYFWPPVGGHAKPHTSFGLVGYDTFSNEWYDLDGTYPTEEAADTAAQERLADLEKSQPSSSSGGQGFGGIQDRVYVRVNCAQCGWTQRRAL